MSAASHAARESALPPAIGRFVPRRLLGRGGQGTVYLAEDPELGREVALKTLRHLGQAREKLFGEARNVARLDHPGIVALFELGADAEPPYLVYQYAAGEPLEAITAGGPLPVSRAVTIMTRVLDAVHYAHEHNVLHRDLTPGNILVDERDNPRILDFGISIALNDTSEAGLHGTPNYMAPEVLAEKPPGPASDLFSLSVVFHELLTGRRLFTADNPLAVIYKILNERIVPPTVDRADLDPGLEQIVMRGLEKDPAARYPSAAAMRDALIRWREPEAAPAEKLPGPPPGTDTASAIAFLKRRMARRPDFPAVSEHISEINQKSGLANGADANELAAVILKDYALTTKLLKAVNSAVYGQYSGSISTVSRAVVILGFEQVRNIALGIVIFEHLRSGSQAGALKDAALSSFFSGMLARELCQGETADDYAEEAFIGAMFHRLGRHLAIYYFPEEYAEVQTLVDNKGCSESAAAREIFGADFYDFGLAIGADWNLPDRLLCAMRPQPGGALKEAADDDQRLSQVCAFSNAVAETLGGEAQDRLEALDAVVERYEAALAVDQDRLGDAVRSAVEATRDYAGAIGVKADATPFLGRVEASFGDDEEDRAAPSRTAASAGAPAADAIEPDPAPAQRQTLLTNTIAELTTAMLEKAPVNDLFVMVLEAFYRGIGFSHVFLMLRDPGKRAFVTRFGFGDDIEAVRPKFTYTIADADDIFHRAVHKGRNAVIIDTNEAGHRALVPDWVRGLVQPHSVLLFPVVVNRKCIALIYADSRGSPLRINAQELKLLDTLVKQMTLGIQSR